MRDVVIIDGVRTAIGRIGGTLKNVEPDFLASHVISELLNRVQIEGNLVDEVILGQAKQSTDYPNIARKAALRAGLPVEIPGYTVHRQCGSGLQSINSAVQAIKSNSADVIISGGAESMSAAPYYLRNARFGLTAGNGVLLDPNTESQPKSQPEEVYGHDLTMGGTVEKLVKIYNVSREEQDEYALRSQILAQQAIEEGKFKDEIVPYQVKQKKETISFDVDEHPRKTNLDALSKLRPVFKEGGTVTAGNSSGRNDGAAAVLVTGYDKAMELGLKPNIKVVTQAVAGVRPDLMGLGPVSATKKAIQQADLNIEDIDLIEINEAFAGQTVVGIKELGMDINKVNVNGGAIALGHPIGATGTILTIKLMNEMKRRGSKYGLVTLCIAGGLGISTIFEYIGE